MCPTFGDFVQDLNKKPNESLPVLMPGDLIPKFIAMPCKCEPARADNFISVEVQRPPKPPQTEESPLP